MNLSNKQLYIIAVVIFALGAILGGATGVFFIRDTPLVTRIAKTDTVTVYGFDTIRIKEEIPVVKEMLVRVEKLVKDTVIIDKPVLVGNYISIPITQKTFYRPEATIWASGYKVAIDSAQVRVPTVTRTITQTIHKQYGSIMSIYAGASTIHYTGNTIPMFYVGFRYERERISTYTRFGALHTGNSTKAFVEAGAQFDILQRRF